MIDPASIPAPEGYLRVYSGKIKNNDMIYSKAGFKPAKQGTPAIPGTIGKPAKLYIVIRHEKSTK